MINEVERQESEYLQYLAKFLLRLFYRQCHAEYETLAGLAFGCYITSIVTNDLLGNSQTHAGFICSWCCCKKRLEDVLDSRPLNPAAGV